MRSSCYRSPGLLHTLSAPISQHQIVAEQTVNNQALQASVPILIEAALH